MSDVFSLLLQGLPTTLQVTAGAFLIGAVAGLPLALARRSGPAALKAAVGFVIMIVRVVPPIVWIFMVYYSIGSLEALRFDAEAAAMVGLGLIAAAYLAEIYRGAIDAVPSGQFDAVDALGLGRYTAYRRVIIPQSLVLVIAPATSYAVNLLKDSALASIIGSQDITFLAFERTQQTLSGFDTFVIAGALYLILSLLIAWTGLGIERLTAGTARHV